MRMFRGNYNMKAQCVKTFAFSYNIMFLFFHMNIPCQFHKTMKTAKLLLCLYCNSSLVIGYFCLLNYSLQICSAVLQKSSVHFLVAI